MITQARSIRFAVAPGERIYAIGDVHGCRQAFERLMHLIRLDAHARPAARVSIIVLGDVIDRGPQSAELLRSIMRYSRASERFIALLGNHEQLMVKALEGDHEALALWLSVGGGATLESFGVDPAVIAEGASANLLAACQEKIRPDIVAWLMRLPLTFRSGDIVFVHAGVRPAVALERQDPVDLLWIREPFLSDEEDRSYLVVHGHTISAGGPDWRATRIGVDTGAYKTGLLTALGLEGREAWALTSDGANDVA